LGYNWSSAKQNYAFCFFFWKKKNTIREVGSFWGHAPKPPGSASRIMGCVAIASEDQRMLTNCILLFSEKEAKSVVPLRGRLLKTSEADPGFEHVLNVS
jgi:hypothetical protein